MHIRKEINDIFIGTKIGFYRLIKNKTKHMCVEKLEMKANDSVNYSRFLGTKTLIYGLW